MFVSVANAMGASGGAAAGEAAGLVAYAPILLFILIFYFIIFRPQSKKMKEHRAMLDALRKGDTVITSSGFIGRIVELDDDVISLDLGETRVQISRSNISGLYSHKNKAA
jgi:preprotein translocase subunit YajC